MIPDPPLPGGCNCGQVRYRLTRPPIAGYICHCHLCQKRTGSAFSQQLVFPADALEIVSGEEIETVRVLPSGQRNLSRICPSCYSRISTRREAFDTVSLRAGTLDDTSWLRPAAQIWTSSAQPWALISGIASWEEQPSSWRALTDAWEAAQ
ncbi:MAG TPA: GFA family protein [Caulobacteraceae bacterium]|nr:GFA family protein [Caulobacteraceae bacterium]